MDAMLLRLVDLVEYLGFFKLIRCVSNSLYRDTSSVSFNHIVDWQFASMPNVLLGHVFRPSIGRWTVSSDHHCWHHVSIGWSFHNESRDKILASSAHPRTPYWDWW